ncbi:MAG: TRAP transporter substrate-binding protein [Peptococcaceae bacterium]|nr:TRAP transporter substrate-binding protein [Peptococcaceae bacterium]
MPQGVLTKGRLMFTLLVCLTAAALILGGCSSKKDSAPASGGGEKAGTEVKAVELKLAHFWPSNHLLETQIVKEWSKAVQDATNGKVKITSYPAETLLKSAETYDGVIKGVADIGISCYAYNRGRFPVMEAFMLPGFVYNNSKVASMVASEGVKQLNPKELQDTKHLMIFASGPGQLLMKNPVKTEADLKGVEIGVTGGPRAEALKLLGASAVVLPMPEMYEAQSKGVIKGTLAPLETLKGFKMGEVTNVITITPFLYNQVFYMVMNKEKWASLPPDVQEAITKATDSFFKEKMIGFFDRINEGGLKFIQEKKKVEIITLSEEETNKWVNKIKPVMDAHVKMLNEKGLSGDQVVKTIKELADKYNQELK